MSEPHDPSRRTPALWDEAAEALPGMTRIAARPGCARRPGPWAPVCARADYCARSLTNPAVAGELVQEVARDVAEASRAVNDVARAVSAGVPITRALLDATVSISSVVLADATPRGAEVEERSLRERGEDLLHRSRDVWSEEGETHPAYARMLDELAPDEARILLLLLRGGPQPSVDVRTGGRSA